MAKKLAFRPAVRLARESLDGVRRKMGIVAGTDFYNLVNAVDYLICALEAAPEFQAFQKIEPRAPLREIKRDYARRAEVLQAKDELRDVRKLLRSLKKAKR